VFFRRRLVMDNPNYTTAQFSVEIVRTVAILSADTLWNRDLKGQRRHNAMAAIISSGRSDDEACSIAETPEEVVSSVLRCNRYLKFSLRNLWALLP
jgi:hypothetical protein